MQKLIILGCLVGWLTACNGGGGGSGTNNSPPVNPNNSSTLLPLNISVHDLANKPLLNNIIDIYKVGAVTKYKLTLTNPNSVAVSIPIGNNPLGVDLNWLLAYNLVEQPGTSNDNTEGTFYKTDNADDCFNNKELAPGSSCSLYNLAKNDFNMTTQESFTYPLSYTIHQITEPSNKLTVKQCTEKYTLTGKVYDCSNESKPGYANQFIKYRLVSLPTNFPYPMPAGSAYANSSFSNDGHYAAHCSGEFPTICYKQRVTFANNNLTYVTESTFVLDNYENGIAQLSTDASIFGAYVKSSGEMVFINSAYPHQYAGATGSGSSRAIWVVQGLDNSIMTSGSHGGRMYKYLPAQNLMAHVKVDGEFTDYIHAESPDGTIVTEDDNHNLICANTTDGINYISRPMQNFKLPTTYNYRIWGGDHDRAQRIHNVIYGYQDFYFTNMLGESELYPEGAFFRITATKNKCSIAVADLQTIDPHDMTFEARASVYNDYVNMNGRITAATNSAIGF